MHETNIMLDSDSYKFGHPCAYLPNTEGIYSYLEARKGAKYNKTLWFGLQSILLKHLVGKVVTKEKIEEAQWYIDRHLGSGVFISNGYEHNGKPDVNAILVTECLQFAILINNTIKYFINIMDIGIFISASEPFHKITTYVSNIFTADS